MFFQSNLPLEKILSKYFWEVGILPDDSNNTEYISLSVNLSNTIAPVFFTR